MILLDNEKNGGNSKLQPLLKEKKSHWERLPIFNELY